MSIKIEFNRSKDKLIKVICTTCKNRNRHIVLSSLDQSGEEPMGYDDSYSWNDLYQIIECQGCGSISFRNESSNSEDYDPEGGYYISELIYPKRTSDTWDTKDFFNVPQNLRRIYRETIDCFNNDNFTLCGAGVRALVEGLCQENNILDGEVEITKIDGTIEKKRKKDLQGKINGLHEKGKLTKKSAEILHEHRFLGNKSIHELSLPSKEELSLAIEIVENILDTLYEIPQKAFQLRSQRLRKDKK
jgi:hypothetical protein